MYSKPTMSVALAAVDSVGGVLGVPLVVPQSKPVVSQETLRPPVPSWMSRIRMSCPSAMGLAGRVIVHPQTGEGEREDVALRRVDRH
jgi:hypothetical protein